MTGPELTSQVEVKKLTKVEFDWAASFYKSVGYVQTIQPEDKFFGAFYAGEMVGLVRLALECGHWILRGMQVKPEFQFFGIGSKLIKLLEIDLKNEICYCLPHGWLDKFYGQIGFQKVESLEHCPPFLAERLNENIKKYPQLILMMRPREVT